MKQLCLVKKSRWLYKTTVRKIQGGIPRYGNEQKWVEWGFGLSMKTWICIEKMVKEYLFLNRNDEVYFYKILQPQFIGLIDHFAMLYKTFVFLPDDSIGRHAYWERELQQCNRLICWIKTYCSYYEEQQSEPDSYFLKENNLRSLIFGLNMSCFDMNNTSYSYVLGRMIAIKKYKKIVQDRMHAIAEAY